MVIGSKNKLKQLDAHHNNSHFRDTPIERVRNFKLLGVHLDENLNFKNHIDHVISKVSTGLKMLYRTRQYIDDRATLICLYHSLIEPYFDYCSTIWGDCNKGFQDKLQKLQNRAGRIITKSDYSVRSRDIRKELHWVTLDKRRSNSKSVMMFKILNGLGPDCLRELFSYVSEHNSYNLRNADINLILPASKSNLGKRAFSYSGARNWNTLS